MDATLQPTILILKLGQLKKKFEFDLCTLLRLRTLNLNDDDDFRQNRLYVILLFPFKPIITVAVPIAVRNHASLKHSLK